MTVDAQIASAAGWDTFDYFPKSFVYFPPAAGPKSCEDTGDSRPWDIRATKDYRQTAQTVRHRHRATSEKSN